MRSAYWWLEAEWSVNSASTHARHESPSPSVPSTHSVVEATLDACSESQVAEKARDLKCNNELVATSNARFVYTALEHGATVFKSGQVIIVMDMEKVKNSNVLSRLEPTKLNCIFASSIRHESFLATFYLIPVFFCRMEALVQLIAFILFIIACLPTAVIADDWTQGTLPYLWIDLKPEPRRLL